jgi:hypothetical protein
MRAPGTTPEGETTYFSLYGLLNSELTDGLIGLAVIRTCKKVV